TPAADESGATTNARVPRATLRHLLPPRREEQSGICALDAVSLRALEVERTIRTPAAGAARGAADGSLVGLILSTPGGCRTPMGKRLVREWLCRPCARLDEIRSR